MDGCPDFTIRDTNRLGRILDYYFLDRATTPLWQLGQHIPVMAQQPIIFRISSEIASGIHIVGADLFVRGVLTMRHSRRSGFVFSFRVARYSAVNLLATFCPTWLFRPYSKLHATTERFQQAQRAWYGCDAAYTIYHSSEK